MEKISEKLSNDYKNQMKTLLKDDYEKYISALDEQAIRGLRVNTKKIGVQDFLKNNKLEAEFLPVNFSSDGFVFDTQKKIGLTDEHLSGLIYIQEPSSMLSVCASGIENENRPLKVLDLCASPGGKTSQIACRVSDDSIIFSNEIIKSRAEILQSNIERQGFRNVIVLNEEPKDLLVFKGFFDYVFVDAPCSGEGMFRKNPETIAEWNKNNVVMCANRQKEILEIAQNLVASGGKLIYSTCTFNEQEDENIVNWVLENFDYELEDVDELIKNETIASSLDGNLAERARKFLPFKSKGEGQFISVFKKVGEAEKSSLYSKKHGKCIVQIGQSENKLVLEFSNSALKSNFSWKDLYLVGDNVFLAPKAFDGDIRTALESLRFVLVGVKIGSIEKNRFEPNHNLFMAHQELFKLQIELNDDELKKYLHGEEIIKADVKEKGYGVVTRNGYAIGGVKVSNGRLKNLYPRGLRV
ncbi:MAG: RsmF rRNA methyltransferase first C-terminal domain-containing protein [Clostridia bacterium]|nr:RsmF rRNA methyltransferase first C-terminal domain-containing protein [Clostridia bacterium]